MSLIRIKAHPTNEIILIMSFSSCSTSLISSFILSSNMSPPFYVYIIHYKVSFVNYLLQLFNVFRKKYLTLETI